MKKCAVIYNPESGYKKNKLDINLVEKILNDNGYSVTFLKTTKKGDARNYVLNLEDVDLVIAAGGDGTLNEVVSGNIKRHEPLLLYIYQLEQLLTLEDFMDLPKIRKKI